VVETLATFLLLGALIKGNARQATAGPMPLSASAPPPA
jgi:hypothetical protein